ncbi:hypothetical protein BT63DRAFT_460356 [Microthyrium microscopicum]|uniref:Uncharacterized protein n=1 Tax=Microthyrium microscopicum TaxID=703497 RepID=A0A6A6TVF3_9PEZI|nr:hypothetical protein BT63DRAFT_460356 [Microthyrium microscopicum]
MGRKRALLKATLFQNYGRLKIGSEALGEILGKVVKTVKNYTPGFLKPGFPDKHRLAEKRRRKALFEPGWRANLVRYRSTQTLRFFPPQPLWKGLCSEKLQELMTRRRWLMIELHKQKRKNARIKRYANWLATHCQEWQRRVRKGERIAQAVRKNANADTLHDNWSNRRKSSWALHPHPNWHNRGNEPNEAMDPALERELKRAAHGSLDEERKVSNDQLDEVIEKKKRRLEELKKESRQLQKEIDEHNLGAAFVEETEEGEIKETEKEEPRETDNEPNSK